MHTDDGRPARLARIFLGWATVAAAIVLACGYGREIATALGVPDSAVGGKLFALDAERNVPAWVSVLLLFSVSATMFRTTFREFALKLGTAWGWLVLAIGFIYLGLDEQMSLHEKLDKFGDDLPEMGGLFHFHWVVFVVPVIVVVGLAFIPFLRRLPRDTAIRLIVAGAVYVIGGIGVEVIGGFVLSHGGGRGLYVLAACIEETLEITGILLALRCMVLHLAALPATAASAPRAT